FARLHGGQALVVIVPKLPARLYGATSRLAGPARWHDTAVDLGAIRRGRRWSDVLSGAAVRTRPRNEIRLDRALRHFPVAVLPGGAAARVDDGALTRGAGRSG